MKKSAALFVLALLVAAALVAALHVGAKATIAAAQQDREPDGLAFNLALWAQKLRLGAPLVDLPALDLAVAYHQLREGSEFARADDLGERGTRFLRQVQPWLGESPLRADGHIDPQRLQAQQQALAVLVRTNWNEADSHLAERLALQLGPAMQAPGASQIDPLLHFATLEALAMLQARWQNWPDTRTWVQLAETVLPPPADIKAQTRENTARNLLRLHVLLASCEPGHRTVYAADADAALLKGFDARQLWQQYTASWDRPLLMRAMQDGTPPECTVLAKQYRKLLTAAQP